MTETKTKIAIEDKKNYMIDLTEIITNNYKNRLKKRKCYNCSDYFTKDDIENQNIEVETPGIEQGIAWGGFPKDEDAGRIKIFISLKHEDCPQDNDHDTTTPEEDSDQDTDG